MPRTEIPAERIIALKTLSILLEAERRDRLMGISAAVDGCVTIVDMVSRQNEADASDMAGNWRADRRKARQTDTNAKSETPGALQLKCGLRSGEQKVETTRPGLMRALSASAPTPAVARRKWSLTPDDNLSGGSSPLPCTTGEG
jgi:hypothetical protein